MQPTRVATWLLAVVSLAPAPLLRAQGDANAPARELVLQPRAEESRSQDSVQFVGTGTVIVRHAGITILTDPNFLHAGDHVQLGYGLASQRLTNPAVEFDALPPIDLVLLSHFHEDHFDREVEARLDKDMPIVTTPQAATALAERGFRAVQPLKQWQSLRVTKGDGLLSITAMPARHGPPVLARVMPETMGSLLELARGGGTPPFRLYVSGDTLLYGDIKEIAARYPHLDLALLHLGGTRLLGILVTMDGRQGVEMIRLLHPDLAIPIHYDDYDVFGSPLSEFQSAVRDAGLDDKVRYLERGETYEFGGGK